MPDKVTHRLIITLPVELWQRVIAEPSFYRRIRPATRCAILIEEALNMREMEREDEVTP